MKQGEALPHKSFYPLEEAATVAGCKVRDLVHYAGQSRISMLIGVPDGVTLRVYDESTRELSEPFVLSPQLLCLLSSHCVKIELQGRTQASDFLSGYLTEPDGGLKKLFPNYGRKDLGRQWVFWRLFEAGKVCLLDLSPDRLFVTRDDLLVLMGEGDGTSAPPPPVRKEKKSRSSSSGIVVAEETGSGGGQAGDTDDQDAGGQEDPVVAESRKNVAGKPKESAEPAESSPKPSQKGPAILRLKHVMERTGLARATIYDKLSRNSPRYDPSFPHRIKLGAAAVGWSESEISVWLQKRIDTNRG
jgi:prophage regulatory protein